MFLDDDSLTEFEVSQNYLGHLTRTLDNETRSFNNQLAERSVPETILQRAIGTGRFGTYFTKPGDFDLRPYGHHLTALKSTKASGLKGLLFYTHMPLIKTCQRLVDDLSKNGFQLQIGDKYVPIDKLKVDVNDDQQIITRVDIDDSKEGIHIPQGTALMKARNWVTDGSGAPRFQIIDANKKPLDEPTSAKLLWVTMQSQGINSRTSATQRTFMQTGPGYGTGENVGKTTLDLIGALETRHGYDILPLYNTVISESAPKVRELLQDVHLSLNALERKDHIEVPKSLREVLSEISSFYKLDLVNIRPGPAPNER